MASYQKPALKRAVPALEVVDGGGETPERVAAQPLLPSGDFVDVDALLERSRTLKEQARAQATKRAYAGDWRHFAAWCAERKLSSLPAEPVTVDLYLAAHADSLKVSTLARRLVAIARVHRDAGYHTPTVAAAVRQTFAGIRREQGTAPAQKAPLLTDDMRKMLAARDDGTLRGLRDRAMLLIGWFGALRASDLVSLTVADIRPVGAQGIELRIRRSKTDAAGAGQYVGIPAGKTPDTDAHKVLKQWLAAAKITRGPLFREIDRHRNVSTTAISTRSAQTIVKRAAEAVGLDPALYSSHSLRAGLTTQAALDGADNRSLRKQGRWKSDRVMERYVRDAELFRDNAAAKTQL